MAVEVDIIVQIARGMSYLHEQGVAHRDLKPENVVINRLTFPHLSDHYYCVKLVDFGMSKTKVQISKSNTISARGVGTTMYRAPEVFPKANPNGKGKAVWFKADVFSFAMTCAHILSRKKPFGDMEQLNHLYDELMNGHRPELPGDCPQELISLKKDCWSTDLCSRPSFREICTRLETLQQRIMTLDGHVGDSMLTGESGIGNQAVGSLVKYTVKEIVDMTNVFERELPGDSEGLVYLASLPERRSSVAVKCLRIAEAAKTQVMTEQVFSWQALLAISRLRHRNLVELLGYCVDDQGHNLFLVYELMGCGSLTEHLDPVVNQGGVKRNVLGWKARMRCALEVAQGLEYLHNHGDSPLVHSDITSENVLFDYDMNAKIADFRFRNVGTHHQAMRLCEDPVYSRYDIPCDKNDVYSFGVILFELIIGRKLINFGNKLELWCYNMTSHAGCGLTSVRLTSIVSQVFDDRGTHKTSMDLTP